MMRVLILDECGKEIDSFLPAENHTVAICSLAVGDTITTDVACFVISEKSFDTVAGELIFYSKEYDLK